MVLGLSVVDVVRPVYATVTASVSVLVVASTHWSVRVVRSVALTRCITCCVSAIIKTVVCLVTVKVSCKRSDKTSSKVRNGIGSSPLVQL